MSMRPMIIVGCGGSGGKVVQLLRRELELQLRRKRWTEGIPKAWQLVYVDTPSTQEQGIPGVPTVPLRDYISVSGGFDLYSDVITSLFNSYAGMEDRFSGWLPEKEGVTVPLTDGAGQMRAVGRATAFSSMGHLGQRLQAAYEATVANSAELAQLYNHLYPGAEPAASLSADQKPYIFVVSSLAGGTGAGIFMDVCDVFRACDDDLSNRISGVLFSAEVFANLTNNSGLQPNSLAALSEIMSGYFDHHRPLEPLYKREMPIATAHTGISGPAFPYVIGTSTMAGRSLPEIMDCYRATTQTLAAVMMNPTDIGYYFTQFAQTNWMARQSNNVVAWTFGNQSPINEAKGVFSSFGSSTLSLGLRRMEEYAIQRAARVVVDFQNHDWQALGHDAMGQQQASSEEIVEFLTQRHGPGFVSDVELLEKDDQEGSNDQIIDQLCSKEQLDSSWLAFRGDVLNQLQSVGDASSLEWQTVIASTVENQSTKFLTEIRGLIAQGREQFVSLTPTRVLETTSRAMARHGLRVARGLLGYAREDLSIAGRQLHAQSTGYREAGQRWKSDLASVFVEAPNRIPADHDLVRSGVRAAAGRAYVEALAEVRDRASELMVELQQQVIEPLVQLLLQIEEDLGAAPEVQQWPGPYGVPPQLEPPPLEFCLVESDKWPDRYVDLVSASASHDAEQGGWETILRTMVGAGGFTVNRGGFEHQVQSAIELRKGEHWSPRSAGGDGLSVKFDRHYEVEDVVDRAREWITREGTAMGDFLKQGIMEYLDDTHADGNAVTDHQQRLRRFEQALEDVLVSASPLVDIDEGAALSVHPSNSSEARSFTRQMEKLPLGEGHPAYSVAARIIEQQVFGSGAPAGAVDEYFGPEQRGVESVTCVSYLNSAVHPAAITSLMSPIAQAWNSHADAGAFWMRRRARSLKEFVPVHPHVLRSMIRGWITGRMLDLIPTPSHDDGFSIRTEQGLALFPWPTVKGHISTTGSPVSWLPALLESIPLAFALFTTEQSVLDAYDELYLLGQTDRSGAQAGSPTRDYQHPGIEITEFIEHGAAQNTEPVVLDERFAPEESSISSPEEDHKQRLLTYLDQFQETLKKQTDTDVNQGNIWQVPDGIGLFDEISACAQEMINTINRVDTASPGEVG